MKLRYTFIVQQVADLYMAVPVGDGAKLFKGLLKFNGTGKDIFEKIQQGLNHDQIVDALLNEYDASREQIELEVNKLTDRLKSENLIED